MIVVDDGIVISVIFGGIEMMMDFVKIGVVCDKVLKVRFE